MGRRIKTYCFIIFLLFITGRISSQMPADSVDIATYNLLMKGNWDDMMLLARKSIRSGTDFHYLRLRMGIYYYNKGNYRRSAFHFMKAYKMFSADDLNNEYLYYACLWGSRDPDSYFIGNKSSPELKNKIGFKKRCLDYIYSDFTYSMNNSTAEADKLQSQQLLLSGYQTLGNTMYNISAGAGHKINSGTSINWAYYRLMKNDYLYTGYAGVYNFYDKYNLSQDHFYLSVNQFLGNGFNFTLSGNFVHTIVNGITAGGTGSGYGPGAGYNTDTPDTIINAVSASAVISKDISLFNVAFLSNYSNFAGGTQLTQTAFLTYYPFGNLNLYVSYIPSYHTRIEKGTSNSFINSSLVGYKIFRYLWHEIYFSYGKMINYSSSNSYYISNDLNTINYIASSNFIIPLKKVKFYLRYSLMGHESVFHAANFDNLNDYNKINYTTSNITGGFIWRF